ncbi:MAG: ACT domain-containing protein [Bdellovibrionales bacterium]|nr:ACT domain-containing protein [Bdellovibrionales bacterium]
MSLTLEIIPDLFAICRLDAQSAIPNWAIKSPFFSVSKTADELSIVCEQKDVPPGIKAERDWRCLKVAGPLDFSLTGILASLAAPLAEKGVSLFAISTFDTDYLLVKSNQLQRAAEALKKAGHVVASKRSNEK